MSGLAAPQPSIQLPPDVVVAGMGRRIVAWIVDNILSGLLGIIPIVFVMAAGGVTFNESAWKQVDWGSTNPYAGVTEPLAKVDLAILAIGVVLYMALQALYFIWSWTAAGGTPGQRLFSFRVADFQTGRNLSLAQATVRWLLLVGIAEAVSLVYLVVFVQAMADHPGSELDTSYGLAGLSNTTSALSSLWFIALLISAIADSLRRGIHDKLASSIVVGRAPMPAYGYPPQAGPYGGYPQAGTPYGYPQAGPGYPQGVPYPPPPGAPGQPPAGQPPATQGGSGTDTPQTPPGTPK
jgi:uncharacterized RDD family membrane protein YckC